MEDKWAAIEQAELEGMERDDMRAEYEQEIEVLCQKDEANTDARARMASEIESLTAERDRLREALKAASEHLDFCGYGDRYERECAISQKLDERISEALREA